MDLTKLLREAVARSASDVHLHADRRPALRIDGRLVSTENEVLSADEVEGLAVAR